MIVRPYPLSQRYHDPCGTYVEWFWLPILGPSTTWAYRRLAGWLHVDGRRDGYELNMAELAASIGVSPSTLTASVRRLVMFGLASFDDREHPTTVYVKATAPTLPGRHLKALPAHVVAGHDRARSESLAITSATV